MMNKNCCYSALLSLALLLNIIYCQASIKKNEEAYSVNARKKFPSNVYWGDTHVHTNLSMDAYNYGNTLGPETAHRFAMGEAVKSTLGLTAKLERPLDFLVIADHSTNMGLMQGLESINPDVIGSSQALQLAEKLKHIKNLNESRPLDAAVLSTQFVVDIIQRKDPITSTAYRHSIWEKATRLADQYNAPGKFTAFIGYEWTLKDMSISSGLHRVVIFKDGSKKTSSVLPFAQDHGRDTGIFWDYLANYEKETGGEVLAIPHNSNLSNGLMFAVTDTEGAPLTAEYARKRSRWEPLLEITQIKGDSETLPSLSTSDEFADYERIIPDDGAEKHQYEYARPALKLGLEQHAKLGVNPFKFGVIGSTDSHTSLSTADENNFWGKFSWLEPFPNRIKGGWFGWKDSTNDPLSSPWKARASILSASGYAAVWAEENTRESIFAAMKRKEVYASTGPRITVRFFGGWDYEKQDAHSPELARIGYEKGVHMGGDLSMAPKGKAPTFLIRAVKDPDGASLDRIQVIKGWKGSSGALHEKIYNVALSNNRKNDLKGRVQPVGNTVDIPDASYTNTIGDPELATVWTDPDFNQDELAFYYLRVLEIPTPRWTAYDAKYFQLQDLPENIPMITQERAYSSPIWYSPSVRKKAALSMVNHEEK